MNGGIADPEEFWKAMGRLHDRSESLHGRIEEIADTVEQLTSTVRDLAGVVTTLAGAVASHERRLDHVEVVHMAMQDDLRGIRAELQAIRERLDRPNGKGQG